MKNITNYKNLLIIALSIFIVILGFQVTSKQKTIEKYEDFKYQQDKLLFGEGRLQGYSCGVLDIKKAQEILDSKSLKSSYLQGPADEIGVNNKQTERLYWSDSCRYVDEFDSSKYVELYIDTFQTKTEAENYFLDFLPIVTDKKILSNENFGEKLVYESGVYYLLKDNKVIQVSTGFNEELSQKIFFDIMSII